ncbi:MAG: BolA/IbaG family iron-sulfur metabolism protein [Gammaproteobacteria bacterium]|nr:BolA/IbaG family iron-sulfur metabolism protein [Gammaproteobacteria bacterium]
MQTEEIKRRVAAQLANCEIYVEGDGSHFTLTVVGELFAGVSNLNRQKRLFATLKQEITSGEIHALDVKGFTQQEWQQANRLAHHLDKPRTDRS